MLARQTEEMVMMILTTARRKTIDAEDLVEILKERRDASVGYEYRTISEIIELVEKMPDLSASVEARRMLP